jgi:hypothetical protein
MGSPMDSLVSEILSQAPPYITESQVRILLAANGGLKAYVPGILAILWSMPPRPQPYK